MLFGLTKHKWFDEIVLILVIVQLGFIVYLKFLKPQEGQEILYKYWKLEQQLDKTKAELNQVQKQLQDTIAAFNYRDSIAQIQFEYESDSIYKVLLNIQNSLYFNAEFVNEWLCAKYGVQHPELCDTVNDVGRREVRALQDRE
jgi:uncharacterized membrane-anchored protein YhcB (DUF1043 family)